MKKYFYAEGSDQNGPFTLEELKEKNISKETLVWHEGLEEWKPAGQVSEVESLFTLSPPPFSPQAISPVAEESVKKPPIIEEPVKKQLNNPPKTWLVESILVTLFCCLPFGIAGIVNASKVESRYYAGDEDEAQRASRNAKKWTSVGFWCGLIGTILYGLLIVLAELQSFWLVQAVTKKWLKWTLIGVWLMAIFFLFRNFNPSTTSFFPKCPFLSLTGLKCPGCGSQRALHHLSNLQFADAFRQNALMVISIPYIFTGLVFDAIKDRKESFLKYRKRFFGTRAIYVVLIVVIGFWVLRNL